MAERITRDHLHAVLTYVSRQGEITNRECRKLTSLGYDSSIKIFGALCTAGLLKKVGTTSGTKYVALHAETTSGDKIAAKSLAAAMGCLMKRRSVNHE